MYPWLTTYEGARFPQKFPQMWKTQANVVRFPLNKVSNWREKRERVALSFSVFNDESDAF